MAEGTIDPNGVYIYDEDDLIATLSAYMNKGQTQQSLVVASLRSRIATLEAAAQVPVSSGRYTSSLSNAGSGASVPLGAWTLVPDRSSTAAPTLWTPTTGGWTFKQRGIYALHLRLSANAALGGRCIIDLNVGGNPADAVRFAFTPSNEDQFDFAVAPLIIPADNTSVTMIAVHYTGAARNLTFRADVSRLGALS